MKVLIKHISLALFVIGLAASCIKEPVKVSSVTVSPASAEIVEGESVSLKAAVSPSDAQYGAVSWSSSNTSIAMVGNDGTVKGVGVGTATITASADGVTGSASITVVAKTISVTGVSLDKTELELTEGDSATLTATVLPEDASDKSVKWTSSDESVAKVSSSGEVTAVEPGSATITVTTNDGGKTATCEVTVEAKAEPEGIQLWENGPYWATFNVGANKPEQYGDYFAWGATEPFYEQGYAQEDPQTHWKNGYSDGYDVMNAPYQTTDTRDINVARWTKYIGDSDPYGTGNPYRDPSASDEDALKTALDLEDDAAHINWGGKWRMPTKTDYEALVENCTWTWTDDYNGTGISGVIVTSNKPGFSGRSIFLPAAGVRQGRGLSGVGFVVFNWSSSLQNTTVNPSSAFVISYSADFVQRHLYQIGGYRRDYGLTVRPVYYPDRIPVSSVSVSPASVEMYSGETYTLKVTVLPENATDKSVKWTSSNESVAKVSSEGVVTAVKYGTATITVTTNDGGKTAACKITVKPQAPPTGALPGQFAVNSNGGMVYFSKGNLQAKYNRSRQSYSWGFAANQWDFVGDDAGNTTIDSQADGKVVDLFGWSTQSTCYGISTSLSPSDYSGNFVDWGRTIDSKGTWRTLSLDEYCFLIAHYPNKWTSVGGVMGVAIAPAGCTIRDKYSSSDWASAEAQGFVFLPAAGCRNGNFMSQVGEAGRYWLRDVSLGSENSSSLIFFTPSQVSFRDTIRNYGHSVRLVSDCR